METQTTATPEQVLERVWCAAFGSLGPLSEAFVLDQGLPYHVVKQLEHGLTPEQVCAALKCWRSKMIRAVDELAASYMAEAKNSIR